MKPVEPFCAALISVFLAHEIFAAEPQTQGTDLHGIFSVVFENDTFANLDNHYTNGIRVSYLSPLNVNVPDRVRSGAGRFPFIDANAKMHVEYALGQNMYTPTDITTPNPDPKDRPYAGWLYFSVGVIALEEHRVDELQLSVGVVGPSARAGQTQDFVHRAIGADRPQGWDHQLHDEPGLLLTFQHASRPRGDISPDDWAGDWSWNWGGAVGNVMTYASVGTALRLGYHLPEDYGLPRVEPSLPGSGYFDQHHAFGFYVFAGASGRAVLRNIFLDGNAFRDSPSVDKLPFVGDLQVGLSVSWRHARLAYTHVFRTREFKTQAANDQFGAISLSLSF